MLNGLDAQSTRFLANLNRIQERSQRAERQIATGLRVEKASDSPDEVGEILRLRTRVDVNVQTQTNLSRVSAQVNTAEAGVREAVAIVERARVIATQAATSGATTRTTLALETRQLHDRLLADHRDLDRRPLRVWRRWRIGAAICGGRNVGDGGNPGVGSGDEFGTGRRRTQYHV